MDRSNRLEMADLPSILSLFDFKIQKILVCMKRRVIVFQTSRDLLNTRGIRREIADISSILSLIDLSHEHLIQPKMPYIFNSCKVKMLVRLVSENKKVKTIPCTE